MLVGARPSGLRLTRPHDGDQRAEQLHGTVMSAAYMGEFVEYHVANDFVRLVINVSDQELRSGDRPAPQVGDVVAVEFDPARTIVLPAD